MLFINDDVVVVCVPDGPSVLPQAPVCHPGRVHQRRERRCGGLHLQPLQDGTSNVCPNMSKHMYKHMFSMYKHVFIHGEHVFICVIHV